MKKILVPCDFSEPSHEAFKFAINLAAKNDSEVYVLHVIDFPAYYETAFGFQPIPFEASALKEIDDDAQRKFEKMLKTYSKNDSNIVFSYVHGHVTSMIIDFISRKKIDLVVIGTHGASGMREFFVGSNTEKIVRLSPVPVFAIRKAVSLSAIKDIIFPTMLEAQPELIKRIKIVQEFFKARLHILYVNTLNNFKRDLEVKAEMEKFVKHHKLTNCTMNMRSDAFEQDGIISFTHETGGDMIVMATHGRKGLAHFLIGSVAEDVVNHVKCPIWTMVVKSS
ncbi:MAG: universal stress protein [Cyclobacteriaceae bacterium]|nr:universal stress protein [Cyclobacteriaceae bacterium]